MKEIFKPALTMCGRMVIVTVMNIFVCISLMVLATAAFTQVDGYKAFVYEKDNDTPIAEYTHKNADGEDTKKAEYEDQGYVVSTQETRTDMSKAGMNTYLTVSQLIGVLLMTGFIYPNVWDLGAKDSNLVKFKHKKENKLRGLKIGLLAVAPAVLIMLLIFVFGRKIFNVALFSMLFANFYGAIKAISGSAHMVGELAVWQMAIMLLLLFIAPAISCGAYLLGYKDISLSERFIYKKNKTTK